MDRFAAHEPLLVNTIGHSVGMIVFAVFLYLLWRDPVGGRLRGSRLSIAAATLALIWNVASLVVIGLSEVGSSVADAAVAVSTTSLSCLPAVLVDLSVGRKRRWIPAAGYAVSAVAIGIHWSEFILDAPQFHWHALRFTTISFGALALLAAALAYWSPDPETRGRKPRLLGTMCLFLFALSFIHFGVGLGAQAWPIEVLVHHAGLPLALFIVLQDFRFVLLDVLLRVLANLTVAGLAILVAVRLLGLAGMEFGGVESPFLLGLLGVGAAVALVGFSALRERIQGVLTRVLFRRGDLERQLARLRTHEEMLEDGRYMSWALGEVGRFMKAELQETDTETSACLRSTELHYPTLTGSVRGFRERLEAQGAEVIVPLRSSAEDVRYYWMGRRPGGQPYLSEDLEVLAQLMDQIAEHVTHYRDLEMRRLVSQAELRALQSQIHPHFLFNALNALYGVIPKEAAGARATVLNLADLLRYFLQSERTYIPLEEELRIVRAYLEVESLRLGDRLRTSFDIDAAVLQSPIPMLSLEPLVENAVRHGVSRKADGGEVRVAAKIDGDAIQVSVSDTGVGFNDSKAPARSGHGVGLENVRRRLKLCYGEDARLDIEAGKPGTVVRFRVPVSERVEVGS